jgi:hypothetical protein
LFVSDQQWLKKMKNKTFFILALILVTLFSCNNSDIFTDKVYDDSIKQNIGGVLYRGVHFSDDIHSYDYDIKYSYEDKSYSINDIGLGNYHGEEPPTDEQLIRFGKWTIFKTSGGWNKDRLFICGNGTKTWTEYEISPETIEKADLWKEQNIDSQVGNGGTSSKIKAIDNDNVTVLYTYAKKNGIFSGKRLITYKINIQTGKAEMTKVSE